MTGISVRSLRNYLRTYPEVLQPKRGYYNSLLFSERDINAFVMIKTLIKDGFKNNEIIEKVNEELVLMDLNLAVAPPTGSEPPKRLTEAVPGTDSMLRVNPKMLQCMNRFLLAQESKNSSLEQRLENMERLLNKLVEKKKARPFLSFQRMIQSTQELWVTLKKAVT